MTRFKLDSELLGINICSVTYCLERSEVTNPTVTVHASGPSLESAHTAAKRLILEYTGHEWEIKE